MGSLHHPRYVRAIRDRADDTGSGGRVGREGDAGDLRQQAADLMMWRGGDSAPARAVAQQKSAPLPPVLTKKVSGALAQTQSMRAGGLRAHEFSFTAAHAC